MAGSRRGSDASRGSGSGREGTGEGAGEGAGERKEVRERKRKAIPRLQVSVAEGSTKSDDQVLAEQMSKLAFTTKAESPGPLSPEEEVEDDFFWESDISSSSDRKLTPAEKRFKPDNAVRRLEKLDGDRQTILSDIRSLCDREYTTAMNVIHTAMYAVKRIHELGEKSPEIAKRVAQAMDDYEGGTAHRDRCYRWIRHYEDSQKLTALIGLKAGYSETAPLFFHDGTPYKGPIEHYNSRRLALLERIRQYDDDNELYKRDHPHLHKNFKSDPFGYGEEDPTKRLPPEISHLPPLEKALERKIWESYTKIRRMYRPTRPLSATPKELDQIFSRGPLRWKWNIDTEYYEFDYSPEHFTTRKQQLEQQELSRLKTLEKSKTRYIHKPSNGINDQVFQDLPGAVQRLIGVQSRENYTCISTEVKGQKSTDPCYLSCFNWAEKRLLIHDHFDNIDTAEGPSDSEPLPNFLLIYEQSHEAAKSQHSLESQRITGHQPTEESNTRYEEIIISQVVNDKTIDAILPHLEDGECTLEKGQPGFDEVVLQSPNCADVKKFVEHCSKSGEITKIEAFRNDPDDAMLDYIKITAKYDA